MHGNFTQNLAQLLHSCLITHFLIPTNCSPEKTKTKSATNDDFIMMCTLNGNRIFTPSHNQISRLNLQCVFNGKFNSIPLKVLTFYDLYPVYCCICQSNGISGNIILSSTLQYLRFIFSIYSDFFHPGFHLIWKKTQPTNNE